MTDLNIQVFSDPICPWCYIGHRYLTDAIESYPRPLGSINITWRTFMLNPGMPDEGMDRTDYLNRKFGGAAGADQVYGRIAKVGEDAGLNMRLGDIGRTPETRSAHQVIQALQASPDYANLAYPFGLQLFQAYFVDCKDISQHEVLEHCLVQAGGPKDLVAQVMSTKDFRAFVIQEDQQNRARGLTGVPGFLVQNQHFVGGAQPASVFHRLFDIVSENAPSQDN